ncbi:acetyl-CoA decarbonylase/synthase complex subunit gamma [Candidatus Thorarchaeota archaeon]|nr:MAG: acetyl-CoA decarbonylase/synthase complex subunit gamma [Candidatus Thorarchaeota archaeon]
MAKLPGPLEIYPLLPGTNCKECGEANCMAFATKMAEHTVKLKACTPLFQDAKYAKKLDKIQVLVRPPVREVVIGVGENAASIGGKLVLYRHDLRYSNPTSFFIDVPDTLDGEALAARIKAIEEWTYVYIGTNLRLDGMALRGVSQDPKIFATAAKKLVELSSWPIMLCSLNPEMLATAANAIADKRPLLYAATMDTWAEVGEIARKHNLPLVAYAPGSLDNLSSLVGTLRAIGLDDIVLDPGTASRKGLGTTVDSFTQVRRSSIIEENELLGYPTIAAPITVWADYREGEAPELTKWDEVLTASALIVRYADLIVLHSLDMWTNLPTTFLRSNLYTDPVKPVAVEAGLMEFGDVGPDSPVMYTTNFALTYFTVESDIKQAGSTAYLVVVDTEGMSVQSAVAGRKLTAERVAETLEEYKVAEKVNHKTLISPGMAARISGETEEVSGWTVKVGPRDSSGIPKYLQEGKWKEE